MPSPETDVVWDSRCRASLSSSRERRAGAPAAGRRRSARRRFLRGGGASLAVAALAVAVIGAGAAIGASSSRSASIVVKRGDRGAAVSRIQKRVHIASDGVFGRLTARAVRRFQRRRGLTVDGIVGPLTRRALGLPPFMRGSVRHPRHRRGQRNRRGGFHLPAILERIAQCESGGNPRAIGGGGTYRGKYQFDRGTWRSVGGHGDPARASEREQDRRALRLYRRSGTAPWPVCGRR